MTFNFINAELTTTVGLRWLTSFSCALLNIICCIRYLIIDQWGWLYVMDPVVLTSIPFPSAPLLVALLVALEVVQDSCNLIFKYLDNPADCHHSDQEFLYLLLSVIIPEASKQQHWSKTTNRMILFILSFSRPDWRRVNPHYQFKDGVQDIKDDKKVFKLEFWTSHTHHECVIWEWKSSKIWS